MKFRDGRELRFTYPSRSTPVGSSEPYQHFSEDPAQDCGVKRWPASPVGSAWTDYRHSTPVRLLSRENTGSEDWRTQATWQYQIRNR